MHRTSYTNPADISVLVLIARQVCLMRADFNYTLSSNKSLYKLLQDERRALSAVSTPTWHDMRTPAHALKLLVSSGVKWKNNTNFCVNTFCKICICLFISDSTLERAGDERCAAVCNQLQQSHVTCKLAEHVN